MASNMLDHDFDDVNKINQNLKTGEQASRVRVQASDLISHSFDGTYHAPSIYKEVSAALGKVAPDGIVLSIKLAPTIPVLDHVEIKSTNTDYHGSQTFARQSAYTPAHWSANFKSAAVKELRNSGNASFGYNQKAPIYTDNVDSTGFCFSLLLRLCAHNSAVREDRNHVGTYPSHEEPTTEDTLLSWPLACEYDYDNHQVKGGHPDVFQMAGVIGRDILQHALLLMADTRANIVKVRTTDAAVPTAEFSVHRSNNIFMLTVQPMVGQGDVGVRSFNYFVQRIPDGRIWLTVPATGMFAMPRKAVADTEARPTANAIPYFLTHLDGYQQECGSLLGKARMRKNIAPSFIGMGEQLSLGSYTDNQQIVLHFTNPIADRDFSIRPRELLVAALAIMRGYAIRLPRHNAALVKLSECMGAAYFMGSAMGGVSAPAVEVVLPPIMTYGIQGMKATCAFGNKQPLDMGLGLAYTHLPLSMGLAVSLGTLGWLASLERGACELRLRHSDHVNNVAESLDFSEHSSLKGIELPKDMHSPIGVSDWRPGYLAGSYFFSRGAGAVKNLATIAARYGSNTPKEHVSVRVAFGNSCHDVMLPLTQAQYYSTLGM
ncbi:hypothetical protein DSL72_005122 [Monilinia vaccinii-corymbosi]|uniref:Uncharacterized protein n=1 Tax=Monilinia vaccinii-corymbosi TaxID=61207 RepID=A0A8A3PES6_9HELO|nr:hypothetical protein DSL72_005122 [Monilinia vaccinii-corymbosi]